MRHRVPMCRFCHKVAATLHLHTALVQGTASKPACSPCAERALCSGSWHLTEGDALNSDLQWSVCVLHDGLETLGLFEKRQGVLSRWHSNGRSSGTKREEYHAAYSPVPRLR